MKIKNYLKVLLLTSMLGISVPTFCNAQESPTPSAEATPAPTPVDTYHHTNVTMGSVNPFTCTFGYDIETVNGNQVATNVHVCGSIITDNITIPNTLDGLPVVSLGRSERSNEDNFLYNSALKKIITIDASNCKSLTTINARCFAKMTYVVVVVPHSTRVVEQDAFYNCNNMAVKTDAVNIRFEGIDSSETYFRFVSASNSSASKMFSSVKNSSKAEVLDGVYTYDGGLSGKHITLDVNGGRLEKTGVHYTETYTYSDYSGLSDDYLLDSKVEIPTKPHDWFAGYYTNENIKVFDENGLLVKANAPSVDETSVYAKYTPKHYTVTLDSNGADVEKTNTIDITYYDTLDLTNADAGMKKTGYHLVGWSLAKGLKEDATKMVTEVPVQGDITLYAIWEENDYTIHFESNNENEEVTDMVYSYNEKVKKSQYPKYQRTGYTMVGFSTLRNGEVLADGANQLTAGDEITLYAIWKPNTYKIRYSMNSTLVSWLDETPIDYDKAFTVPTLEEAHLTNRKGYHFIGWSYDNKTYYPGDKVKKLTASNNKVCYFKALWEVNEYQIKFDKNATDANGTMNFMLASYDSKVYLTANKFTRLGYEFKGWSTEPVKEVPLDKSVTVYMSGKEYYANKTMVSNLVEKGEITLYAIWKATNYKINYEFDSETSGMVSAPTVYTYGESLDLPTPKKLGCVFKGWKTSNGDIIQTIRSGQYGNLTLKATWAYENYEIKTSENIVSLKTSEKVNLKEVHYNQSIKNFEIETKNGYHITEVSFVNEKTNEIIMNQKCSTPSTKVTIGTTLIMPTSSVVVKIVTVPIRYNILYQLGDSTFISENIPTYYHYGTEVVLPNQTLLSEKTGYKLVGWKDEKGNLCTKIDKNEQGNKVFTIVWEKIKYPVKLNLHGGNINGDTGVNDVIEKSYTLGERVDNEKFLPTPTREGYTFDGWIDVDDTVVTKIDTTRKKGYDLYARWINNYYTEEETLLVTQRAPSITMVPKAMSNNKRYQYQSCTPIEKRLYTALYNVYSLGTRKTPDVSIHQFVCDEEFTYENVMNAGAYLIRDYPELFWIRVFNASSVWKDAQGWKVSIFIKEAYVRSSYLSDVKHYQENFGEVIKDLNITNDMTTYQKVERMYTYIGENYSYRNTSNILDRSTTNETRAVGYMLSHHEGCCESYAKLMQILCEYYNIPSVLVSSSTHMWNIIQMSNGKWYFVDATWGDTGNTVIGDWLLFGTEMVKDDIHHQIENAVFIRYDENGNEVPNTDYGCPKAPTVEVKNYIRPMNALYLTKSAKLASKPVAYQGMAMGVCLDDMNEVLSDTKQAENTISNIQIEDVKEIVKSTTTKTVKKIKKIFKTRKINKGKIYKILCGNKIKVSNKKVVKVKKGIVKALKKGKATITTLKNGKKYIYHIIVK